MTGSRKRALTPRDMEVLCDLAIACNSRYSRRGRARPLDIGGGNGSHHSATLNKLVRHGLADREAYGSDRSWTYAPTTAGRALLAGK